MIVMLHHLLWDRGLIVGTLDVFPHHVDNGFNCASVDVVWCGHDGSIVCLFSGHGIAGGERSGFGHVVSVDWTGPCGHSSTPDFTRFSFGGLSSGKDFPLLFHV